MLTISVSDLDYSGRLAASISSVSSRVRAASSSPRSSRLISAGLALNCDAQPLGVARQVLDAQRRQLGAPQGSGHAERDQGAVAVVAQAVAGDVVQDGVPAPVDETP